MATQNTFLLVAPKSFFFIYIYIYGKKKSYPHWQLRGLQREDRKKGEGGKGREERETKTK